MATAGSFGNSADGVFTSATAGSFGNSATVTLLLGSIAAAEASDALGTDAVVSDGAALVAFGSDAALLG